jgi:hypothetical protein
LHSLAVMSARRPVVFFAFALAVLGVAACGDARAKQHFDDSDESEEEEGSGDTNGAAASASTSSGTDGTSTTPGGAGAPQADPTKGNASAADLDVAVDKNTLDVDLFQAASLTVTVTPKNNFSGSVALSATGLPGAAKATFSPAALNVSGNSPVTAKLDISGIDTAGSAAAKIVATAGSEAPSAGLALNVKARITLTIPAGVQDAPNAFGVGDLTVKMPNLSAQNPLVVTFVNKDAAGHTIHAGGCNGFTHGGSDIPQNGTMVRNITGTGNCASYIHNMNRTNPSTTIKLSK